MSSGIVDFLFNFTVYSIIYTGSTIYYYLGGSSKPKQKFLKGNADEEGVKAQRPKVVVISGCDRGFGRMMVEEWAKKNDKLIIVALTLTKTASEQFQNLSNVMAIQCDVTSEEDVKAMKQRVQTLLKDKNAVLYSIINNAGIADPGDFVFLRTLEVPQRVMDVNYFGQLRVTQALLPLMMCTSRLVGGKIFNLSSVCGCSASAGNSSYSASKFAIEAWSSSLRLELEPFGIEVATIRPGQTRTDIQTDWLKNYMKSYHQAPTNIKAMYGEEAFVQNVQKIFDGTDPSTFTCPEVVVGTIYDALLSDTPLRHAYWIGRDASTLWKAFYDLPSSVSHTVKSLIALHPQGPKLPPVGSVSHVTIRVRDLKSSIPFYEAFGCETFGPMEHGMQFLHLNPSNNGNHESLILLKEDKDMPKRGNSFDAGMTRLAIYTQKLDEEVQKLETDFGIKPMGPVAFDSNAKIAAFKDPDGFVVYLFQVSGAMGVFMNLNVWWRKVKTPCLFHWTVNVSNYKAANKFFEAFRFKTLSDQNKDQVINGLLPSFNMCPRTTEIEWIRLCLPSQGGIIATIMQWVNPKSVTNESSSSNSMTFSVSNVEAALEKARELGCHVDQMKPSYEKLPLFGEVCTGTAMLEEGNCPIQFCCFSNHNPTCSKVGETTAK